MPGKNRSAAAFERRRGARQVQLGFHADVPIASDPLIDPEGAAKCNPAAGDRSVRADEEWQRPEQPWRDARERAPLEDRMPRVPQPQVLQRPKAAVDGLLMVERRGASEVGCLDERRAQPAAGGVVRDGQPVDPAADNEHVEGGRGERLEIARSHDALYSSRL